MLENLYILTHITVGLMLVALIFNDIDLAKKSIEALIYELLLLKLALNFLNKKIK